MPTQMTILRIFVASPSDIIKERKILDKIVGRLNTQLGPLCGINFKLVQWETDTHPDIGEDAQSVINKQIGENYDIFIGILWARFGTPTKNAMSGTEEEFHNAYKRAKEDNNVKVMFYFSDSPISPSKMEAEQLAKINSFKSSLPSMGVYYGIYKTKEDFSRYVDLHLGEVMKEYGHTWGKKNDALKVKTELKEQVDQTDQVEQVDQAGMVGQADQTGLMGHAVVPIRVLVEQENTEEEGFLDLVISSVEEITSSSEAINRISAIMAENNQITQESTKEMNSLEKPINPSRAKIVINKFAEKQENFVQRMNVEIPILSKSFRSGIDGWTKSARLLKDFNSDNRPIIEGALDAIRKFKGAIGSARISTRTFKDTVESMPRLTTRFNHSKRLVVEMLGDLIDEYAFEESLSTEAEKIFVGLLENI